MPSCSASRRRSSSDAPRRGSCAQRLAPAGALAALFAATGAQAQSLDDSLSSWLQQPYMTGEWGGVRTKLEKEGISLRAHYVSETAGNPTGGLRQATQYAQQIDFGADLDLEKLAGLKGGQIHVTFSDRAGNSLSDLDLGAFAEVQEIFGGGQDFRLAILTYEQSLFDDMLDIKGAGSMSATISPPRRSTVIFRAMPSAAIPSRPRWTRASPPFPRRAGAGS